MAQRSTAYRFDAFTLDLDRGALLDPDGVDLPLRPKSFSLLRLMVENAGRLISHDTIMDAVWPDLFVTENNVSQCIHEIRHALGTGASRALRTVPRRGYLFASPVVAVAEPLPPQDRVGWAPPLGFQGCEPESRHESTDRVIAKGSFFGVTQRPGPTVDTTITP